MHTIFHQSMNKNKIRLAINLSHKLYIVGGDCDREYGDWFYEALLCESTP